MGGWYRCLAWASDQTTKGPVKIVRARAGSAYAPIVAEVTTEGVRAILGGRQVRIKDILSGKR
jgi:hypothetical protein